MKELKKLALILRALGFSTITEEMLPEEEKSSSFGQCIIKLGRRAWYVWAELDGRFEVQFYYLNECIYDGVYCDTLFDVVDCIFNPNINRIKGNGRANHPATTRQTTWIQR